MIGKLVREKLLFAEFKVTILNDFYGAIVCDLVEINREWNFEILQDWLPIQWINKLHSYISPWEGTFTDVFYFAGTSNEEFSLNDVFNEVSGFDFEQEGDDVFTAI